MPPWFMTSATIPDCRHTGKPYFLDGTVCCHHRQEWNLELPKNTASALIQSQPLRRQNQNGKITEMSISIRENG